MSNFIGSRDIYYSQEISLRVNIFTKYLVVHVLFHILVVSKLFLYSGRKQLKNLFLAKQTKSIFKYLLKKHFNLETREPSEAGEAGKDSDSISKKLRYIYFITKCKSALDVF